MVCDNVPQGCLDTVAEEPVQAGCNTCLSQLTQTTCFNLTIQVKGTSCFCLPPAKQSFLFSKRHGHDWAGEVGPGRTHAVVVLNFVQLAG